MGDRRAAAIYDLRRQPVGSKAWLLWRGREPREMRRTESRREGNRSGPVWETDGAGLERGAALRTIDDEGRMGRMRRGGGELSRLLEVERGGMSARIFRPVPGVGYVQPTAPPLLRARQPSSLLAAPPPPPRPASCIPLLPFPVPVTLLLPILPVIPSPPHLHSARHAHSGCTPRLCSCRASARRQFRARFISGRASGRCRRF